MAQEEVEHMMSVLVVLVAVLHLPLVFQHRVVEVAIGLQLAGMDMQVHLTVMVVMVALAERDAQREVQAAPVG